MTTPDAARAALMQDPDHCADCKRKMLDEDFLNEVNPPGGYGDYQVLLCDECMGSDKWAPWREEHWPTWPAPRRCGS